MDKTQVAGISFGGQMHGLVILDEEDNVIRPAILWNDGRTGAETEYLKDLKVRTGIRSRYGGAKWRGLSESGYRILKR